MKNILGLDLGTNSIGWAVVSKSEEEKLAGIRGSGVRIIPMSQDVLGNFDAGNSASKTAERIRTEFRGTRRLRERHLLRRERLHRVLHRLGFLPEHYEQYIDFEKCMGKFVQDTEPKLPWKKTADGKLEFLFQNSFDEMLADFVETWPQLLENNKKIPYDWTIYYLRKKALSQKIEKEELAWIVLNFNQKRGYYQLRGEEEKEKPNKLEEFHSLKIVDVVADEKPNNKGETWYSLHLENGWIYRRSSRIPLFDWKNRTRDFIVTTDLNSDGTVKIDKEGTEKRSFRAPNEDDWTLMKKKTEADIEQSRKTVGTYIYEALLQNPSRKIRGKLVRTIERKFYKEELVAILEKQVELQPNLFGEDLYNDCVRELYGNNEAHQLVLSKRDFVHLFVDDIIFYQRPLRSKKSLISNCPYEYRIFKNETGTKEKSPVKCIAKSHPLYQEFRLWQFIHNLRIYEREKEINGKLCADVDVTAEFLPTTEEKVKLFDWLNERKEIKQNTLLQSYFKIKKQIRTDDRLPYRWNYVEDKEYPCNEIYASILSRLGKLNIPKQFLDKEKELALWHILYSVNDKKEIKKALKKFADRNDLNDDFIETFAKFPPFEKKYGSYSVKAIKKLLPLMRRGKYWDENAIPEEAKERIQSVVERLEAINYDEKKIEKISDDDVMKSILKSFIKVEDPYSGLNTYQACYAVYGRHSEGNDTAKWKTPQDIDDYLNRFKQHSLRNPVVEQIILETLRVVRDIWKKYGDLSEIHIELGREMKNPADKRAKMMAKILENENTNFRIKVLLMELTNHADVENVRPNSPGQQELLKLYEEGVLNSISEIPDDIVKITQSSQPTQSELIRYKLWIEQKYHSPYTGKIIPLGKLFTLAYEVEHIIPQSRYFDDSLSNKVICEAEVNRLKDNALGYEFIKKHHGEKVSLNFGRPVEILSVEAYETFVKNNYGKLRGKMKKLLLEDIPDSFVERQLNDSRHISKIVKGLLSNVVRKEGEREAISTNVIPCTGGVTAILKQDWGLNDVWNKIVSPRFERMNELTKSSQFGQWINKNGKNIFQTGVPLELQKGFNKKRIDHRHHALDALVIACATRKHIQYLNNEHAKSKNDNVRYGLMKDLRRMEEREVTRIKNGQQVHEKINVACEFHKPWGTFTQDVQATLENIIVSFKQNLRVINKTTNKYQVCEDGKKILKLQENSENWAIRKQLHKETVFAKVTLQKVKTIRLSEALKDWKSIVYKELKSHIKTIIVEYGGSADPERLNNYFKDRKYKFNDIDISKVQVYYFDTENAAVRKSLDTSFTEKVIKKSVTDTGIQKILLNHLKAKNNDPELAFSPEGIDEMNQNILQLNDGKFHQPVHKVRVYETIGNKFPVGFRGNKPSKYVEAAKGTNLFFAIYADKNDNRTFETIPLNVVIERLKQGLQEIPEHNDKGDALLFHLSPNDLVYVPIPEEIESETPANIENICPDRVYKMMSCTGNQCFFVPNNIASPIVQTAELGANNKSEKTWDGTTIKQTGIKIIVNRIGFAVRMYSK
ncbi:MAG: type II CRISPR RNA-guided endonuclease Cas9 [Dysgonamonadaceae bacterium]|jgi:CRISPR-associated endonuclease Csn1|nr:type II CRISPR RNA-guided endonuclease Cas9 [Dysgonamonadaceae bacterium]